jgi:hypothetical protein
VINTRQWPTEYEESSILQSISSFCFSFLQDFDTDLKKDTSGDFRQILKALLYSPVEYDCHELHRATKGLGTNEEILIEILITRSHKHLQAVNNLYPKCSNIILPLNLF